MNWNYFSRNDIEPTNCELRLPKTLHDYIPTDIPELYICEKCKTLKIIRITK